MRIEILLFIITGAIIANIYTDGKYVKQLLGYKKYYKMVGVVVGALFVWWILKKSPESARQLLISGKEYINYLPVDRNVSSFIEPLIDFTSKQSFSGDYSSTQPILSMGSKQKQPVVGGRTDTFKRSVSESKKKYVASNQGWKCKECNQVLPATYEIDHIVRLQHGGSNEISNLQALCPSCHRTKTMVETFSI